MPDKTSKVSPVRNSPGVMPPRPRQLFEGAAAAIQEDLAGLGMAIAIMFGLTFVIILTMVVLPVRYATLNRLQPAGKGAESTIDNEAAGQPA